MTDAWTADRRPQVTSAPGAVILLEGVTFCICDRTGDIGSGTEQGLFFRDTRFLSHFRLSVAGQRLEPLTVERANPYSATFVAQRPARPGAADSTLLVIRRRYVGNGLFETITVRNLGQETTAVALVLSVDADFAGLFEVKEDRLRDRAGVQCAAEGRSLRISYRLGRDSRQVTVTGDCDPTAVEHQLGWQLVVPARAEATVSVQVTPGIDGVDAVPRYRPDRPEASQPAAELAAWRQATPVVQGPDERFGALVASSAEALGMLRILDPDHPERAVAAAGAPWFMTLFGRDSLLTSWMVLPLDMTLAVSTMHTLARLQGRRTDPLTEEEPGRILHEVRSGLDAESPLGGSSVYYGSIDATPLFMVLLGELHRWGLPQPELDALLPHADRALEWIEHYGDRDGDGFVEYQRATDRGLVNQGWKDSFDAIGSAAGGLAEPPIALAEVQGYVYAAYLARARLTSDPESRAHWQRKAATLKRRFNDAFWLADRGYYAIALDGAKHPVDALASNIGHCLWTGIVDDDKAPAVAAALRGPTMFTGFGVRTLASSMGAYNPISYHNGSVWPHDNAIVAAGLMRYGFAEDAGRIALGLLDAAQSLGGQLPELFCGFDRSDFAEPVPYPTSCSPQAWAAATPLSLLRTLLRFEPDVPAGVVSCAPAVPAELLPLRVERLHVGDATVSVDVTRDGWQMSGLPAELREAS